jgi:hypothetical protein
MDELRKEYVAKICSRFVDDYLLQLDNFHSKGKSGRKICLGEFVVPNHKIINRAIQCLHPIELREDLDEDIEIEHPDPIREPEEDPNPLILEPELDPAIEDAAPATREAENVVGEVEPDATGSGRECVGNKTTQQTTTTRPGRRVTTPAHSLIVFTSLNCLTPLN